MKKLVLAAMMVASLVGCKQDPLDGYSKNIRDAGVPGTKPTDKTESDSLMIDTDDYYEVREGDNLSFTINGRVVIPNLNFDLTIENIADFPGMTFNPKTGDVRWRPALDFVKSGAEVVAKMKVMMLTNGAKVLINRKEIPIIVRRQFVGPEVLSVNSLQEMEEGQVDDFQVTVRSAEESTQPSLAVVLNRSGVQDGAAFVELDRAVGTNPIRSTTDPSLWTFYMKVDLVGQEVTASQTDLYFGLQAISSFGLTSVTKSFSFKAKTSFQAALSTWLSEKQFRVGTLKETDFEIYDVKGEGRVTAQITNCQDMPGAVCTCAAVGRSNVRCSIVWNPDMSQLGRSINVNINSQNASPIPGDTRVQNKSFSGFVKVVSP